jgi:hypothetical protein
MVALVALVHLIQFQEYLLRMQAVAVAVAVMLETQSVALVELVAVAQVVMGFQAALAGLEQMGLYILAVAVVVAVKEAQLMATAATAVQVLS